MVDLVDRRSLGEKHSEQFEILDSKSGKLSVQRLGAKITNLTLSGVSVLGKFLRGDSKYAETHPCTPVFGPDKVGFGLPQHGPVRNTLWEIVDYKYDRGLIVLQNRIQGGSYPQGMPVTQEFVLQNGEFCLTTTHKNEGNPKKDFFNSSESMIKPGEERQTQITLKLLSD
jgi:D-hexose-6-phosphate mutarotase